MTLITNFPINTDFGYVLLSACLLGFQCILIGAFLPGRIRGQVFNQDFMKSKFGSIHASEIGGEITKGGYPDMGCGTYAQALSYKDWFRFNNAQRAHYNFLEGLASTVLLIIVGGIYYPVISASFGLAHIIGRLIYSVGYTYRGPAGRTIGAIIVDIALIANFVLMWISCIKFIKGELPT